MAPIDLSFADKPAFFLAFFVASWTLVLRLLSIASGWTLLAEIYRADTSDPVEQRRFRSMTMARKPFPATNFNSIVTMGAEIGALRLSLFGPLSLFHPPLRVPIDDLAGRDRKLLVFQFVDIDVARVPGVRMSMSKGDVDWLERAAGRPIRRAA
jgi:hypothetical protein